jgi:hypothetical protein
VIEGFKLEWEGRHLCAVVAMNGSAECLLVDSRKAKKERKEGANASSVTMRSWYIIKVQGNGPVDALCVVLEMILVLQLYSTDFVPEPISFNMGQMLPLKVLRQVSRTCKLVGALSKQQALLP